jgi:hypothetical protein
VTVAQATGSYPTPYLKWTFQWLRSPPLNHLYLWLGWLDKLRHLICLVILIINIYGLGVGILTIKSSLQIGVGMTPPPPEAWVTRHLICLAMNFSMVKIPTPKPFIFMIRVTRQIKCIIVQAPGSYPTPYLKWTFNG